MGGKGSGRKKTPDHVLAHRGSPRRSKRKATRSGPKTKKPAKPEKVTEAPNDEGVPRPPPAVIRMPSWLPKGLARTTWRKMLPVVKALRIMTIADVPLLARYCVTYARWQRAEQWLDGDGSDQVGTPEYARTHRQALQLAQELRRIEASLGFTPAARRKLGRALTPSTDETPEQQRERMKHVEGGKDATPAEGSSRFFGA